MEDKSGCHILNELWDVAIRCNVDNPGITGVPNRIVGFVECGNVRNFMSMATMKCWQERNSKDFPPLVLEHKKYVRTESSSKNGPEQSKNNYK